MNNSEMKQLIREKGFLYGNMGGLVVLIKPDRAMVVHMTTPTIEWLESLSDRVKTSTTYRGRYAGDQVQIFHEQQDYAFWGLIGRITKVTADRKVGTMLDVMIDEENSVTVPGNAVTVINREGVVDLQGMTAEERMAVVEAMTGISQRAVEAADLVFSCECLNEECSIEMAAANWHHLDALRGNDESLKIVSQSCPNLEGLSSDVVNRSGNLILVALS